VRARRADVQQLCDDQTWFRPQASLETDIRLPSGFVRSSENALSRIVNFNASTNSETIHFDVIDDGEPELPESFFVQVQVVDAIGFEALIMPGRKSVFARRLEIGMHGDPLGVISLASLHDTSTLTEGENFSFAVHRVGGIAGGVRVAWYITGVAATSADFTPAANGTVEIPAGEPFGIVTVTVAADGVPENLEVYNISLESVELLPFEGLRLPPPQIEPLAITIAPSDGPGGTIAEPENVVVLPVVSNTSVARILRFDLARTGGSIFPVAVTLAVLYDETGAGVCSQAASVISPATHVKFDVGQHLVRSAAVSIVPGARLQLGARLCIKVESARVSHSCLPGPWCIPLIKSFDSPLPR
jgi:hypothetical protein